MIDATVYSQVVDMLPIVTVDVVPFTPDFSQVLLFKRINKPAQDEYYSPGGRLLKNETFIEGAIRQCQRELGLDIEPTQLIPGGAINEIWNDSAFESLNYHSVNIFFGYPLSKCEFSNLKLDNQHHDYKWFDIQDTDIHPYVQERVKTLRQNAPVILMAA